MSHEVASTINTISVALHKLAESKAVASVKHELHDTADRIQHKMEAWHEAVDAWVARDLPNLDAARKAAFAEFKEELARGRSILERHKGV